jgi:hypothetical protein
MRHAIMWFRTIRNLHVAYHQVHRRWPRLFRPRSFTEKMQWRKLFDRNPLFTVFCDKLATRALIAHRIGVQYLTPLLWTGMAEEIPFDRLTPPYFLKSTHASGQVMRVSDIAAQNPAAITAVAADWLRSCYGAAAGEPGYKNVPRRLIAEQEILAESGGAPEERRFFVFDGRVSIINTVFIEAGQLRNGAFHTPGWERLDWHFTRLLAGDFPKPTGLAEMLRIAEILGQGIDHVRVDIYDCGETFFVGELTPYSWSGMSRFNSKAADLALGRDWRINRPLLRALAAMASGPPGSMSGIQT